MRITIIQGAFFPVPPIRGGAVEKLWHRLALEFAAMGHEVVHISRRYAGLPDENQENGVHYVRVRGHDQPANGLRLKLLDLLYSLRAARRVPVSDIIVTNTFWTPLLLRSRKGVYVSVERMPKGQMKLYRRAVRLRACSSAVRKAILGEDPAAGPRVRVIPNPLPEIPTASVSWREKEERILYVGRVHPEKGIELLLEAFVRAKARVLAGWKLDIVGPWETHDGGGGNRWAQTLRDRYARSDIEWTGPLFRSEELADRYRRARVFAYPSVAERGEAFPIAPLEAMAWGTVPIVSALACFRDFITPPKNGLIFNHRDADPAANLAGMIASLPEQPLEAMSLEALCVRETHSPKRIATLFLSDFESVVRDSSKWLHQET